MKGRERKKKDGGREKILKHELLCFCDLPNISVSKEALSLRQMPWPRQVKGNEICPHWPVICMGGRQGFTTTPAESIWEVQKGTLDLAII